MPFAMILAGVLLFMTALNGTYKQFGSQLYKDLFTDSPPFVYWVAALMVVGLIGYIPGAKKPADAFMALIIVAMVLKDGGLFTQIQSALQSGPSPVASASPLAPVAVSSGSTSNQTAAGHAVPSFLGDATSAVSQTASVLKSIGITI